MVLQRGSITLPVGAVTAVVAGAFGTGYGAFLTAVSLTVPWFPEFAVTTTTTQFTAAFSVPVPPGGAVLMWEVDNSPGAAQGAVTLGDYLDDTRRLLRGSAAGYLAPE